MLEGIQSTEDDKNQDFLNPAFRKLPTEKIRLE